MSSSTSNADQEALDAMDGDESPLDSALAAKPKPGRRKRKRKAASKDVLNADAPDVVDVNAPDVVVKKKSGDVPKWKFRVQSLNREKPSDEQKKIGEPGPLMYNAMDVMANDEIKAINIYCRVYRLNATRHKFHAVCLDEGKRLEASRASKRARMETRNVPEEVIERVLKEMAA